MDNRFDKQKKDIEIKLEYTIGSNIIKLNNEEKYLSIIVWSNVTYEDIKEHIVK